MIRYRFPGGEWQVTTFTPERHLGLFLGGAEIQIVH